MCCDVHVMPGGRPRIVIMRIWLERLRLHSTDPGGVTVCDSRQETDAWTFGVPSPLYQIANAKSRY